jgi:hypothetical protein
VEDLRPFIVKLSRYSKYAPLLKNSIAYMETPDWRIFLMIKSRYVIKYLKNILVIVVSSGTQCTPPLNQLIIMPKTHISQPAAAHPAAEMRGIQNNKIHQAATYLKNYAPVGI